jgi:hopanoid-associated phosphorylase
MSIFDAVRVLGSGDSILSMMISGGDGHATNLRDGTGGNGRTAVAPIHCKPPIRQSENSHGEAATPDSRPPSKRTNMSIIAVCGLKREAAMLACAKAVVGGGNARLLRARLDAIDISCKGIISVGICGALSVSLKVGDCVIANEIVAGADRFTIDAAWRDRIAQKLPEAVIGAIAGSDTMLIDGRAKRALGTATGAIAADMESHVAASFAAERGFPFAAVRVVSDQADAGLPEAVLTAMKPDGGIALGAVLRSLAANPGQLPGLVRTAWGSEVAFRALFRCLGRLGPGLLGSDLG